MMKSFVLFCIHIYRSYISPLIPPRCRFQPTCSQFGFEAIQYYGVLKGGWMTIKRISKCHPFHQGGFDPLPLKEDNRNK